MENRSVFARVKDGKKAGGEWMWLYKGTWADRTFCILYLDYNNVYILAVTLNCSSAECYHGGKLSKG